MLAIHCIWEHELACAHVCVKMKRVGRDEKVGELMKRDIIIKYI